MGHWDLFFKNRITKIIPSLWHAPWALNRGWEQAVRATFAKECVLWGCPWLSFMANLPFGGMRQVYAAFEKEIPMAL